MEKEIKNTGFSKDALVLTDEGFKPIDDLMSGDYVLTASGKYNKIIRVSSEKCENAYKLDLCGFPIIAGTKQTFCTSNIGDLNAVVGVSTNNYMSEPEYVSSEKMTQNHYTGTFINQESSLNNTDYFSPEFWWLIGRYIRCGKIVDNIVNIYVNKYFWQADQALITETLCGVCECDADEAGVRIMDEEIVEFLSSFGTDFYNKNIPNYILDLPKLLLQSFIDGFFSLKAENYIGFYYLSTPNLSWVNMIALSIAKVYNKRMNLWVSEDGKYIIKYSIAARKKYPCAKNILWNKNTNGSLIEYDNYLFSLEIEEDNTYLVNGFIVGGITK